MPFSSASHQVQAPETGYESNAGQTTPEHSGFNFDKLFFLIFVSGTK
jgi:hypothetical protein